MVEILVAFIVGLIIGMGIMAYAITMIVGNLDVLIEDDYIEIEGKDE